MALPRLVPFVCAECGKEFKPIYGDKKRRFCSANCCQKHSSRNTKAVRRARIKNVGHESIDLIEVLERDEWICQICGDATPRHLRGTIEPNAPEVDHIIPIVKGGTHTWDNVQCACRNCNQAKSDRMQAA